jgi:hypothetical protein
LIGRVTGRSGIDEIDFSRHCPVGEHIPSNSEGIVAL